jgi:DNA invertase Pin-like site-specific DNA recombinase
MQTAAYVRVSTDDQNEQRQMRAIRAKYDNDQEDNQIDWYCDLGESGASTSRQEYQRLREHVAEYDVVVAHELDRLGRSFADLAEFVEDLREKGVDIDLVNQPTIGCLSSNSSQTDPKSPHASLPMTTNTFLSNISHEHSANCVLRGWSNTSCQTTKKNTDSTDSPSEANASGTRCTLLISSESASLCAYPEQIMIP